MGWWWDFGWLAGGGRPDARPAQLHLEIIHQEEAVAEREKACELQLQGLRDDVSRLQFLNSQKTQQVALKVRGVLCA